MRPIRFVAVEAIIGASKGTPAWRPSILTRLWRLIEEWFRDHHHRS
jgi:hypothetical protein